MAIDFDNLRELYRGVIIDPESGQIRHLVKVTGSHLKSLERCESAIRIRRSKHLAMLDFEMKKDRLQVTVHYHLAKIYLLLVLYNIFETLTYPKMTKYEIQVFRKLVK